MIIEENPERRMMIDDSVFTAMNNAEDVFLVRAQGLDVDDDNDPAPDNIPNNDGIPTLIPATVSPGQTRGWSGIDQRADIGGRSSRPSIINPTGLNSFKRADNASCFELFFPFVWLKNVVLVRTNTELVENKLGQVTIGEFLRYLGIWFLLLASLVVSLQFSHFLARLE